MYRSGHVISYCLSRILTCILLVFISTDVIMHGDSKLLVSRNVFSNICCGLDMFQHCCDYRLISYNSLYIPQLLAGKKLHINFISIVHVQICETCETCFVV